MVSGLFKDYWELCKPNVVALMLLTAWVGMILASNKMPGLLLTSYTLLGIALSGASAATINHIVDKNIDKKMARTANRPIANERITARSAIIFATTLGVLGLSILYFFVNSLTAILTFMTLIGYAGIYTGYLKRATPQNIVIGGLAGAAPPLLGWAAVTNSIEIPALVLVLIIFTWTPPHFWALALYRIEEYKNIDIPMLPVVKGELITKRYIIAYVWILSLVTLLPFFMKNAAWLYLFGALFLNIRFIYLAYLIYYNQDKSIQIKTFWYSIWYLAGIFLLLLLDHLL